MPADKAAVTDSPWFWILVFLCGGLIVLTVAEPQIRLRQQRLDKQFHARQQAGQTVPLEHTEAARDPASDAGPRAAQDTLVPLRPVYLGLVLAIVATSVLFWWTRFRQRHTSGSP